MITQKPKSTVARKQNASDWKERDDRSAVVSVSIICVPGSANPKEIGKASANNHPRIWWNSIVHESTELVLICCVRGVHRNSLVEGTSEEIISKIIGLVNI